MSNSIFTDGILKFWQWCVKSVEGASHTETMCCPAQLQSRSPTKTWLQQPKGSRRSQEKRLKSIVFLQLKLRLRVQRWFVGSATQTTLTARGIGISTPGTSSSVTAALSPCMSRGGWRQPWVHQDTADETLAEPIVNV